MQLNANADQMMNSTRQRIIALVAMLKSHIGARASAGAKIFFVSYLLVAVICTLWLMCIPPKYSASVQLAPQASPENSASSSQVNLGGGLSSLLGAKNQPTNLTAFQTLLGTAGFSAYLIQHDHLDKIVFPHGVYHSSLSRGLHLLFNQGLSNQVTPADMVSYLQSNFYLQPDDVWGYLRISYSNSNRENAIKFLTTVIYSGDQMLRRREGENFGRQIRYLGNLVKTTTDLEQQQVFRQLLAQKLASKVLIDTQNTYAFKIFDLPYAPSTPNSPNVGLLVLAIFFLALVGASIITGTWWLLHRLTSNK